jgi:hypothetical protein
MARPRDPARRDVQWWRNHERSNGQRNQPPPHVPPAAPPGLRRWLGLGMRLQEAVDRHGHPLAPQVVPDPPVKPTAKMSQRDLTVASNWIFINDPGWATFWLEIYPNGKTPRVEPDRKAGIPPTGDSK